MSVKGVVLWNRNEEYSRSLNIIVYESLNFLRFRYRDHAGYWNTEEMSPQRARGFMDTGGIIKLTKRLI